MRVQPPREQQPSLGEWRRSGSGPAGCRRRELLTGLGSGHRATETPSWAPLTGWCRPGATPLMGQSAGGMGSWEVPWTLRGGGGRSPVELRYLPIRREGKDPVRLFIWEWAGWLREKGTAGWTWIGEMHHRDAILGVNSVPGERGATR
ncbi:hypothetical protein NDU88_008227 [Pleurodeles waltl]|uniref:Uncharacterized protein n=1 Tax=Pleurodeles waltl TaxID=8319 RepID=A0AAV7QN48_PLEWA|nr:hypothetical protein NDU88_008227 [Pleurodeles waltl]